MDSIKKRLETYPDVSFIEDLSFEELKANMIKEYQEEYKKITGKEISLAPADPERLKLYACAVYLYQAFSCIDKAGKMGLLKYSGGDFLENLGAILKVERNQAKRALTTLKFTLSEKQNEIISIPKGTRVKVKNLYFETTRMEEVKPGEMEIEIPSICQTPGVEGNGYLPGQINTLVDPIAYVQTVENVTESQGGAEIENDDEYAERIYLAPSSFATAGPESAYTYHVKTYSQAIKDCYIVSENPGEVDIYIVLENGEIPDETFIKGLQEYLSNHQIRPLTDHVVVKVPQIISYHIELTYYIDAKNKEMAETIKKNIDQEIQNYIAWQKEKIGRDINPSYFMYRLMSAGIKWADIKAPIFQELTGATLAIADNINVIYGGLQND